MGTLSKRVERLERMSRPAPVSNVPYIIFHGDMSNGIDTFIDVIVPGAPEIEPEADPNLEFVCEDGGTRIYKVKEVS